MANETDAYWNDVTLLLDLTTDSQDKSTVARSTTSNISLTAALADPWGNYTGVASFIGSGYSISTTIDLSGVSNFTIEGFINPNSTFFGGDATIVQVGTGGLGSISLVASLFNGIINAKLYDTTTISIGGSTPTPSPNIWHHWAIVKVGTKYTLYLDYIPIGTASSPMSVSSTTLTIGSGSNGVYFQGYMSNIRITKGIARNISAVTAPFPFGQVRSVLGDPLWANVNMFIPGTGETALTTAYGSVGQDITSNLCLDGATITKAVADPWGGFNGVFATNGTASRFSWPYGSQLNAFTNKYFTFEVYVYSTDVSGLQVFMDLRGLGDANNYIYGQIAAGGTSVSFVLKNAAGTITVSVTTTIAINTWYRIALKRNDTVFNAMVNTTVGADVVGSGTYGHVGNASGFGGTLQDTTHGLKGYLSNLRYTTGVLRDLTFMPTEPFPRFKLSYGAGDQFYSDTILYLDGTSLNDLSIENNTLVPTGTVSVVNDSTAINKKTIAINNATGTYAIGAYNALYIHGKNLHSFTSDFTFEIGFKYSTYNGAKQTLLGFGARDTLGDGNSKSFSIYFTPTMVGIEVVTTSVVKCEFAHNGLSANIFQTLTIIRKNGTTSIYKGSVLLGTSTALNGVDLLNTDGYPLAIFSGFSHSGTAPTNSYGIAGNLATLRITKAARPVPITDNLIQSTGFAGTIKGAIKLGNNAAPYLDLLLSNGPVQYWPLTELSGTGASNIGSAGTSGLYVGAPTGTTTALVPSSPGAILFAQGKYCETNINTSYNVFSVSAVFMINTLPTSGKRGTILSHASWTASGNTNYPFSLHIDTSGKLTCELSKGTGIIDLTLSSYPLVAGQTYRVDITRDASGVTLMYLDGSLVAKGTLTGSLATYASSWRIGIAQEYSTGLNNSGFIGYVSHVAIFDKARTASEINTTVSKSYQSATGGAAYIAKWKVTGVDILNRVTSTVINTNYFTLFCKSLLPHDVTISPYIDTVWSANWTPSINMLIAENKRLYKCTVSGATGATKPSFLTNSVADNLATWAFVDVIPDTTTLVGRLPT